MCKLKYTEKRFIPFSPLHFLPEFVPHPEFKGRPEDTKWNVLYHTALRNYAATSLQVPSILSILLGFFPSSHCTVLPVLHAFVQGLINYTDTKAKCRHLKKSRPVKGLRGGCFFIRVYRSVCGSMTYWCGSGSADPCL